MKNVNYINLNILKNFKKILIVFLMSKYKLKNNKINVNFLLFWISIKFSMILKLNKKI